MRILNVTQSYAPFFEFGGPPAKVKALAEGLAQKGHDVTVLTADWGLEKRVKESPGETPAQGSPFGRKRETNGVKAIYLANWLRYRTTTWNPALGRYLRARLRDFDVVHIFGLYDLLGPRVASECHKQKIPYVVEPIGMYRPIVRSFLLKRIYHQMFGSELMAEASAVVATSEQEVAELTAGGIAQQKIVLRRNGIGFPQEFPERGIFRKSLGIEENAKIILFLGRLSQKKSPDLLLNAFAKVASDASLHLAFVGPDEAGMRGRLETSAGQLGLRSRVHFVGPLEGKAKWAAYRDAYIFVLPSQNENFGNTAGESVAAGTPVVITDQCGIAPILANVAGIEVKHELEDLVGGIEKLLKNQELYQRLRQGCATAVERLSWKVPLREMEALYGKLAVFPQSKRAAPNESGR
jgi:glycosyltransferase involved in cell wall biosynthesis